MPRSCNCTSRSIRCIIHPIILMVLLAATLLLQINGRAAIYWQQCDWMATIPKRLRWSPMKDCTPVYMLCVRTASFHRTSHIFMRASSSTERNLSGSSQYAPEPNPVLETPGHPKLAKRTTTYCCSEEMDLGNTLQTADVAIGVLSLSVTLTSTYLTWHAMNGIIPL